MDSTIKFWDAESGICKHSSTTERAGFKLMVLDN